MDNMYNVIDQLCKSSGTNVTAMCRELNIARSSLSELKQGRTKSLSYEYISKIANFFNVNPDYIAGKTNIKNKPAENGKLTKKDEKDITKILEQTREQLLSQEGLMFDGNPASDEAIESILNAMQIGMEMAKLKNKEKYNPKKYKKD